MHASCSEYDSPDTDTFEDAGGSKELIDGLVVEVVGLLKRVSELLAVRYQAKNLRMQRWEWHRWTGGHRRGQLRE